MKLNILITIIILLIILLFAVVTLVFNKLENKVVSNYRKKLDVYSNNEKMKSLITSYYSNKLMTVNIREYLIKIILIILMVVTIILQSLIAFGIIPNDYIL